MKNKKFIILLIPIFLTAFAYLLLTNRSNKEQQVLESTYDISREYLVLRLRTDDILVNAKNYPEYKEWDKDMTTLVQDWEALEKKSMELGSRSINLADELAFDQKLIFTAEAYSAKEINAIYDKAPRFKKIATLANHLGVDAKRAQLILNQAQDETSANVFSEEGNAFEKLENTAIVVKDGCKVAGFVGGVVLTGGAAGFAAAGTITQATVVIAGVDLALEVTEDSAQIALGDKNKISSFVKDVRTVTEPVASIMTIAYNPKGLGKGLEKLDSVLFGLEQFRDAAQEGKVVGIDLRNFAYQPPFQVIRKAEYPGTLTVAEMEVSEVEEWLRSINKKYEPMSKEEIEEFIATSFSKSKLEKDSSKSDKSNDTKTKSVGEENGDIESNNLNGTAWKGTVESMSGGSEEKQTIELDFVLNKNGTVSGSTFKKWVQEGDRIKLFGEDASKGYFEFKVYENELLLTKMLIGGELIQPGERYMGGIAPAGFIYKKSSSETDESQAANGAMPFSEFSRLSDDGELNNIATVTEKLGEPDVKTTDGKGRIIYVYYDLVKYDSGNLGSIRMSFYNEDQYKSYVEGMGGSWDSNKENWDTSGGGIRATEEIKPKETFKKIYGE